MNFTRSLRCFQFRPETPETQQWVSLRWEQVNLCQVLQSGEFICKDTQTPRNCAVLARVGKGKHMGWKQATSAYDLLWLLLVFPVKPPHSLRWPEICVVKIACCWRTWQIPPVHWFSSAHPLANTEPHSYVSLLLTILCGKPTTF